MRRFTRLELDSGEGYDACRVLVVAAADAYLATQGDVWDTQWDMFMCLIDAPVAQLLLYRTHDRQLATIQHGQPQAATAPAPR